MSLIGKVALVTGAAQGLGRAFSEILLKNGAKVGLTDYNESQGTQTLNELGATYNKSNMTFVKCDITKKSEFEAAFSGVKNQLGNIDIVINNAGIGIESEGWESTIRVNVEGTLRGTMLALDHLRTDKGGHGGVIVNVASMAGLNPNPCGPVYCASKAAIIMFSRCWAMNPDVSSNGVRINILAPAFANTPLVHTLQREGNVHRPDIAAKMLQMVGVMPVENVAEGLLELVVDETKSNALLEISAVSGKNYR